MQANEETPPALAPLFNVADVLEQELPKQDENERTAYAQNAALATTKAADQTNANPYAEYLGKGGTIYVHVFDVDNFEKIDTNIRDSNGKQVRPTKKVYKQAELICNEHFKELGINLKVKIVFAEKNSTPMSKEEFQMRQDYNPMDSYLVVWDQTPFNSWEDENKDKTGWPELNIDGLGYSAGTEFYSVVNTFFYDQIGSLFQYNNAVGKKIKLDNKVLTITPDLALAMGLAKIFIHESGHPKFSGDPGSDVGWATVGGHTPKTIMQKWPVYGLTEHYNSYQISVLEQMHGKIPINPADLQQLLAKPSWQEEIDKWQNMSWKEIVVSLQDKIYNSAIAEQNINKIMSTRTDLPKK